MSLSAMRGALALRVVTGLSEWAIRSDTTSLCLDLLGGDTTDGTDLHLAPCTDSAAERWNFLQGELVLNSQPIVSCVDVAFDGSLHIWTCNGAETQGWSYNADARTIELTASSKGASADRRCVALEDVDGTSSLRLGSCDAAESWELGSPLHRRRSPPRRRRSPLPTPSPAPSPGPVCSSNIQAGFGCLVAPDIYIDTHEVDATTCCALCEEEAECAQWVFYPNGNHCGRSNVTKPPWADSRATCGTKMPNSSEVPRWGTAAVLF